MPPGELAEAVAGSDLAAGVSTEDMAWLAGQIAQLTDWERYVLGLAAEQGLSSKEIAYREFVPLKEANLRPILKRLRQKQPRP
jgi:DNA-binding NarL/FixJ family response regulator